MKKLFTWLFGEPHKHIWRKKDNLTVFGFPSDGAWHEEMGGRGGDFLPVNLTIYKCSCPKEKRVYQDIWNKKYKEVEVINY